MKPLSWLFVGVALFGGAFFEGGYDERVGTFVSTRPMLASVFFTQSTSAQILRTEFQNVAQTKRKLSVLVVPGHEPFFGGTEYRDIKERDLNAELALDLAQYLVEDGHYDVTLTRGSDGWNPVFSDYFTSHGNEIKTFVQSQKAEMARLVGEGKVTEKVDNVPHNDAPDDVALRLYGINKWANEHKIDIIIHVHFNDSAPRRAGVAGEYNGFSIYTPEHQYSNAQASNEIAKNIFKRLSRMFPVSNLPQEDQGIIEDQNLIAVGSGNTVDAASLLVEYGYIYEPQLQKVDVRTLTLKELAFQTYLGLADFFGETSLVVGPHQSTLLPYEGKVSIRKTASADTKVLAFQAALSDRGFYPPQNSTKNDCPVSGVFGTCTKAALAAFQNEFEIKGEKGIVGSKTRAQLRALFQPSIVGVQ